MIDQVPYTNILMPHAMTAKVLATRGGLEAGRHTRAALRSAAPHALIRATGSRGVFMLEAEEEASKLAETVTRACAGRIGHLTLVLVEVESTEEAITEAASRVGVESIGADETYCFRLKKRGAHWLQAHTPELEREIGSAIWRALETDNRTPHVDLEDPDITIRAEVLGPRTAIGIFRKAWRTIPVELALTHA